MVTDDVLAFAPRVDSFLLVVSQGQTARRTLANAKEVLVGAQRHGRRPEPVHRAQRQSLLLTWPRSSMSPELSIVVPLFNEEDSVRPLYAAIVSAVEPLGRVLRDRVCR